MNNYKMNKEIKMIGNLYEEASFASEYFQWVKLDDDDFICKVDKYTMRVEKMNYNHWWFRVYFMDIPITEFTNEYCCGKYQAIGRCEGMVLVLLKKLK